MKSGSAVLEQPSIRNKAEPIGGSQILKQVARGNGDPKIEVEFKLNAPGAQSVALAGSFNNWDAKKTTLRKQGDCWTTNIKLPRGRYEYRFVVDGQWVSDPSASD